VAVHGISVDDPTVEESRGNSGEPCGSLGVVALPEISRCLVSTFRSGPVSRAHRRIRRYTL